MQVLQKASCSSVVHHSLDLGHFSVKVQQKATRESCWKRLGWKFSNDGGYQGGVLRQRLEALQKVPGFGHTIVLP